MTRNLIIIGCGGVGSNIAMLVARHESNCEFNKIVLVDHDVVEKKNLSRQFFFECDIGKPKVVSLKENLLKVCPELSIDIYQQKIVSVDDLMFLKAYDDGYNTAILATDNTVSKRLVYENYNMAEKIIINCDRDYYEIKFELDNEELNAWSIGTGYNSTQTWLSNLAASAYVVGLFCELTPLELSHTRRNIIGSVIEDE